MNVFYTKSTQSFLTLPLLAYCCGVVSHAHLTQTHGFLLCVASLALTLFHLGIKPLRSLPTMALILLFTAVGILVSNHQRQQHADFLRATHGLTCSLDATVSAIEEIEHHCYNYKTTLNIDHLTSSGTTKQPINHSFFWYSHQKPECSEGDKISMQQVKLKTPNNQDFVFYLCKEQIFGVIFDDCATKTHDPCQIWSLKNALQKTRSFVFATLRSKYPTSSLRLFFSLFMGNKEYSKKSLDPVKNTFNYWGISHFLARSGLHLMIFVILWSYLFRLLPINFYAKQWCLMFFSVLYMSISWPSISFTRAFFMFALHKICLLQKIRTHFLHTITVVALGVLLINPLHLYFLDFQLSFLLTYALVWISSRTSSTIF